MPELSNTTKQRMKDAADIYVGLAEKVMLPRES